MPILITMRRITVLLVLLAGCATRVPQPPPASTPSPAPVSAEDLVDHSGDSPETAISVPEDAPDGGIVFENQWIFDRYGRFKRTAGGTGSLDARRYDVVKIELPNGEHKSVYFDITENWLQWSPSQPK